MDPYSNQIFNFLRQINITLLFVVGSYVGRFRGANVNCVEPLIDCAIVVSSLWVVVVSDIVSDISIIDVIVIIMLLVPFYFDSLSTQLT